MHRFESQRRRSDRGGSKDCARRTRRAPVFDACDGWCGPSETPRQDRSPDSGRHRAQPVHCHRSGGDRNARRWARRCGTGPSGKGVRHRESRAAKAHRQQRCRTTRGRCWRGAADPGGARDLDHYGSGTTCRTALRSRPALSQLSGVSPSRSGSGVVIHRCTDTGSSSAMA